MNHVWGALLEGVHPGETCHGGALVRTGKKSPFVHGGGDMRMDFH